MFGSAVPGLQGSSSVVLRTGGLLLHRATARFSQRPVLMVACGLKLASSAAPFGHILLRCTFGESPSLAV